MADEKKKKTLAVSEEVTNYVVPSANGNIKEVLEYAMQIAPTNSCRKYIAYAIAELNFIKLDK